MIHNQLLYRTQLMSVLRSLQDQSPLRETIALLRSLNGTPEEFAAAYGCCCSEAYTLTDRTADVMQQLRASNNALTDQLQNPSEAMLCAVTFDLETINELLSISGKDICEEAAERFGADTFSFEFPPLPAASMLPVRTGEELCAFYQQNGFGFFASGTFFTIDQENHPVLVMNPDPVRLSDLKGYAMQKEKLLTNTLAFLDGRQANNALLYGDKGTGKSSTIKAIVNEYADRGLKIIEMSPFQLNNFPKICAMAAQSPYRIIVFLDDLSFDHEDNQFSILKAFIEGGLTGKPDNLILYATSNRRHLVRERFSDRAGDDIHVRDTLETISSLSDRFGLEITFGVPDKDEYLYIVDELAEQYGLDLGNDTLHLLAERFAIRRNGRSPRTARQFIQFQLTQDMENK